MTKKSNKTSEERVIAKFEAFLDREEREVEEALAGLYGDLPPWFPEVVREQVRTIVGEMLAEGITATFMLSEIRRDLNSEPLVPGVVREPVSFSRDIYKLKKVAFALKLEKDKALKELVGKVTATGIKFTQGRQPNSLGPIRKVIKRLLAKDPKLKNKELWRAIENKPPVGWEVMDNRTFGKYLTGPENQEMKYPRFRNICSMERGNLNKR